MAEIYLPVKQNQIVSKIDYKYNEEKLLQELREYIDKTYGEHYSNNRVQSTEFIIDSGHGKGFTVGNIIKYAQRVFKKGKPEDWRKDILKIIHYALMLLYIHDLEQGNNNATQKL